MWRSAKEAARRSHTTLIPAGRNPYLTGWSWWPVFWGTARESFWGGVIRSLYVSPKSALRSASMALTRLEIVGSSSPRGTWTTKVLRISKIRRVARMECPPRSKKLSSNGRGWGAFGSILVQSSRIFSSVDVALLVAGAAVAD